MTTAYVMHRRGTFEPVRDTKWQCGAKGHEVYHYHIVMAFDGEMKLDHRKFILDHVEVDQLVQESRLSDSCELMHRKLHDRMYGLLVVEKGLPLWTYRCTISPALDGPAQLQWVWIQPGYMWALPLLNGGA